MSSENLHTKFTARERETMDSLHATIESRDSSKIEKEIAEARLDDLKQSKEPAPKNHKHRLHRAEDLSGNGGSNFYHNDEAFERFAMGGNDDSDGPFGSKVRNQTNADHQSVKMNHKARGAAKGNLRDELLSEDIHNHTMG